MPPIIARSPRGFFPITGSAITAILTGRRWLIIPGRETSRLRAVQHRAIHDISYDKQGNPIKPVSSYVTDIAQRIGGGVEQTGAMPHAPLPPHDPYALHAQAMQNVMLDPNLNENERQHAFQFLQRNFTQAQVAAEADTKAKKDANDAGMNDYVSGMLKSGTATPDMMQSISGDPRLTAETKENLYRFATQDFGFEGTSQYGNNYADMYRRIFPLPMIRSASPMAMIF